MEPLCGANTSIKLHMFVFSGHALLGSSITSRPGRYWKKGIPSDKSITVLLNIMVLQ